MVRYEKSTPRGKFLLVQYGRYNRTLYYRESGTANAGTDAEQTYCYMTRYIDFAMYFQTAKTAQAMQKRLAAEHGIRCEVIAVR